MPINNSTTLTNGGNATITGSVTVSTSTGCVAQITGLGGGSAQIKTTSGALGISGYNEIDFNINTTQYAYLNTSGFNISGSVVPAIDNTYNLGSSGLGWANIYTNDLHLSNENKPEGNDIDGTTGNWTIQEGEENLYIINNKNGKRYKIKLEEI